MKRSLIAPIVTLFLIPLSISLNADIENISTEQQICEKNFTIPVYTNEIAAIVNKDIITMERVRMDIAPLIKQIQIESRSEEEFEEKLFNLELETINSIINRKLIVEEFLKKGGKLSDIYEKKEYENYLHNVFGGDRLEFAKFLKEYGKSVREFKTDVKERAIINFMISELRTSQPEVSPIKIQEYYNSHLSDFFKPQELEIKQIVIFNEKDNAKECIEKIIKELSQGESFENVAKQYSDNFANYDMGYICPDDLITEISENIKTLNVGSYSKPIEINGVTYIFFVANESPAVQKSLQDVSHEIEEQLFYQYQEEAKINWLKKLRGNAYIKIFLQKDKE